MECWQLFSWMPIRNINHFLNSKLWKDWIISEDTKVWKYISSETHLPNAFMENLFIDHICRKDYLTYQKFIKWMGPESRDLHFLCFFSYSVHFTEFRPRNQAKLTHSYLQTHSHTHTHALSAFWTLGNLKQDDFPSETIQD